MAKCLLSRVILGHCFLSISLDAFVLTARKNLRRRHYHNVVGKTTSPFDLVSRSIISSISSQNSVVDGDGDANQQQQQPGEAASLRLSCGLLISSFNDGLKPNKQAHDFLLGGLVQSLLLEYQHQTEQDVAESAVQSPCCGPNAQHLEDLDKIDGLVSQVWTHEQPLSLLQQPHENENDPKIIRFVYIPTAMYALRPESRNTPGKQRQRARSDGKKRRNEIVKLLETIMVGPRGEDSLSSIPLSSWDIQAVTVDLDDDSVKQPQGGDHNDNVDVFPTSGKQALTEWNPHFVYVEGGNTFWLHHCMQKGDYQDILKETLCSTTSTPTVYCGSSAGAILVGACMETACWKGWDNPQVVPGMESYQDWKGVAGLNLVDGRTFFPHMEEDKWTNLVQEKRVQLPCLGEKLVYLNEDDVFCLGKHLREPVVVS
eukprot:CAMPEP_0198146354 /NCGR_PEP_ID=MMETSP1443-20131203/29030_1 /TAXON_ID=186043 /ORGANISM="Entomoneis sp., Strain CCMP2396" /LENGTH=427 /DNA_ID=CAMNT_0043810293 /DNA_START=45 /DNA_END=1328 /DNA_ORIENTATION=+